MKNLRLDQIKERERLIDTILEIQRIKRELGEIQDEIERRSKSKSKDQDLQDRYKNLLEELGYFWDLFEVFTKNEKISKKLTQRGKNEFDLS